MGAVNAIHRQGGVGMQHILRSPVSAGAPDRMALRRVESGPRQEPPTMESLLPSGRHPLRSWKWWSRACCRLGLAGLQGAQSWGTHSPVVTWKSNVLRSEGFPPPPSSPASANAVWTCTNLSQPSSLTDSNQQNPVGRPESCRGPPGHPSPGHAAPAPRLLLVPSPP